jgi:galactokinase
LDILVEESMKIKGTLGSRMMGAGFGGCIVSVVEKPAIPGFIESAGRAYQSRTGRSADFYIANTGDGARQIE